MVPTTRLTLPSKSIKDVFLYKYLRLNDPVPLNSKNLSGFSQTAKYVSFEQGWPRAVLSNELRCDVPIYFMEHPCSKVRYTYRGTDNKKKRRASKIISAKVTEKRLHRPVIKSDPDPH